MLDSAAVSIFTYSGRPHLTPKYSGLSAQLTSLNEKTISLGVHYVAIRDCGDDSCKGSFSSNLELVCQSRDLISISISISIFTVIHVFDLIPGASRQNDVTTCHTKATVNQIAVSRAGNLDDQYLIFIDGNRDIFCTSLRNGSNFVIHKIGKSAQRIESCEIPNGV